MKEADAFTSCFRSSWVWELEPWAERGADDVHRAYENRREQPVILPWCVCVIYNKAAACLLSIFLLEGMQDLIKCLDSLLKKKKRVSVQ